MLQGKFIKEYRNYENGPDYDSVAVIIAIVALYVLISTGMDLALVYSGENVRL